MRERDRRVLPAIGAILAVVVTLAALLVTDGWFRHGYTVAWLATSPSGEHLETARTTEHRIVFPNDHRPMARIVEGWNFRRLGVPVDLPPIDARLLATIVVPRGGRFLHTTSSGETTILVDGLRVSDETRTSAGPHRLEVDWRASIDPSTYFQLEWGPSPGVTVPVPRDALTPGEGAFPPTRTALWVLGLLFALTLAFLVHRILANDGPLRARWLHVALTLALVCTALGFRLTDYSVMPDWRDNDDERFACWNGYFLLTEGRPRALTIWPAEYVGVADISVHAYFGRSFHLITPYFEHPPLFHLLVGGVGWLGGAREFREIRLGHARLVPIALAGINVLLILAIGRRLERRRTAAPYFGALLYAVLPWLVIQTRVIKEEVLLTPLSCGVIYFFLRWRDDRRMRDLVLAAVLAGLCALAKVPGAAFVLALAVLLFQDAGLRPVLVQLAISLPIVALWPLYGAFYGWRAFALTQSIQASRMVHFNIFLRFFDDAIINGTLIGRGWLLFLWLGTLGAVLRRSRAWAMVLGTPLIAYLAAIALGSGDWTYGWYVTPLLPWLCLGAGAFLADAWAETDIVRGGLTTFVLLFYTLNFAFSPAWIRSWIVQGEVRSLVTTVLVLGWGPFALATAAPSPVTRGLARAALVGILAVVVVESWLFVFHYDEFLQIFGNFDRNRSFDG